MAPVLRHVLLPVLEPVLSLRPRAGAAGVSDPDAAAWIALVEAADGSPMAAANKTAVNDLVIGMKADASPNGGVSNWQATTFMCLLAGPSTLAGALIPLRGVAPTGINLVGADQTRLAGIAGDGASKLINSNRAGNADAQDNSSAWCWVSTFGSDIGANRAQFGNTASGVGGVILMLSVNGVAAGRMKTTADSSITASGVPAAGIWGMSRNSPSSFDYIIGAGTVQSIATVSTGNSTNNVHFLGRGGGTVYTLSRLGVIGLGAAVNLTTMKSRMAAYMAALV